MAGKGKTITSLAGSLELYGGRMFRGNVKKLSMTSATFSSSEFARARNNPPTEGDPGALTFSYTRDGVPFEIKVSCRLVQYLGNIAQLALMQGDLTKRDSTAMKKILEVQSSEIGPEGAGFG